MDYESLAEELLDIQVRISQMQFRRDLDNFSRGELRALRFLYEHGMKAHPVDLSRDMGVSSARIAVLLNNMAGKGWIERSSDESDQRHTVVTLTPAGVEVLQERKQATIDSIVQVLRDLGEEDAAEFVRLRRKMVKI